MQFCHFTAALQSDMSLQDCTAVEVDGATTKMGCEKKCCENMSHDLVYTYILYSAFRSVGSIRLLFDILHHPAKFQAICTNSFPTRITMIDTEMEHRKTSDTNETSTCSKKHVKNIDNYSSAILSLKNVYHVFKNATLLEVVPAKRSHQSNSPQQCGSCRLR